MTAHECLADNTRKLSNAPLRLTEQRPPRRTTKPCPHCGSTNTSEKQSNT